MIYKLLFLLVFMVPYNLSYGLEQIECPKWLPGTDEILPAGATLSPELELQNAMRCYCEIVKAKERDCIEARIPSEICKQRTADWVSNNLRLAPAGIVNGVAGPPRRNVIINEN